MRAETSGTKADEGILKYKLAKLAKTRQKDEKRIGITALTPRTLGRRLLGLRLGIVLLGRGFSLTLDGGSTFPLGFSLGLGFPFL